MNDYEEVTRGKELLGRLSAHGESLFQVIFDIRSIDAELGDQFNETYKHHLSTDLFDTFVSCWSVCTPESGDHDNLAMWRGYAADGNGVAIVIDPIALGLPDLFESEIVIYRVHYETDQEFALRALKVLEHFRDNLKKIEKSVLRANVGYAINAFAEVCFLLAITHKHSGFKQEREWRFVWRRHKDHDGTYTSLVRAVSGRRGMYEYFCFPIKPDERITSAPLDIRKIIKEVMIGPTDDSYLKARAVKTLLAAAGFDLAQTAVTISPIPYRTLR